MCAAYPVIGELTSVATGPARVRYATSLLSGLTGRPTTRSGALDPKGWAAGRMNLLVRASDDPNQRAGRG